MTAEPIVDNVIENEVKLVPRYKVIIHNDDVTHFAFVMFVLMQIFRKGTQDSLLITQEAHLKGCALVTVLPYEEAEFRVEQAKSLSRTHKFPLAFSLEPE